LTRNRRKSGAQGGSRKKSAGASLEPPKQEVSSSSAARDPRSKRGMWIAASVTAVIVVVGFLGFRLFKGNESAGKTPDTAVTIFVGSETCAACHRTEADLWRPSQHNLAMQHATDKAVLGDFNDAAFDYFGVHSRFFRKDGKFLVETDGPDGKLATFEVKYTFGIDPLQQYLVEFPDGRVQALSLAWDSRPRDKGGQRWFHLYPNEQIKHDDVLHWTRLNQNWNFMCARCHSTGLKKNYDAATDRFATTFAEISVGCEACHGRGSRHVRWARDRKGWWPFGRGDDPDMGLVERFNERRDATWSLDATTGNAIRSRAPRSLRAEVETCGLCHARRSEFSEDWTPGQSLSDTAMVLPLRRGLYYADGQMQDEVYNYGSFKQSRMFAAGVTCSDCHEPHGAKLRSTYDGVCLRCHAPGKYAAASHHHHENVSPALTCASCHMPVRTYMVVDPRHDHSFRIPRPDLSVQLKTPNACNDCHADKSAQWAASAVETWHGPNRKGFQTYAAAFDAAWNERLDAPRLLAAVASNRSTPAIARASALGELGARGAPPDAELARAGLADPDPMVRLGALDLIENLAPEQRWSLASPLLSDPIRGVRVQAASELADVPAARLSADDQARFDRAAEEFVAAQKFNADRPEARSTLGNYYARRGRIPEAEAEYKAALRLSPQFAGASINLADLYRQTGRESEGETVLRAALESSPREAGLHHALGLTLVRLKHYSEALIELRRAMDLEPDGARYAYVYGVALHSVGRGAEAMTVLKGSLARHPYDRDILSALFSFSREAGDNASALKYAEQLARIEPGDQQLAQMIEAMRRPAKKPDAH